jgi:hypothetical protein
VFLATASSIVSSQQNIEKNNLIEKKIR